MAKVTLITGGSRGIGEEISSLFIQNGIEVLAPSHMDLDLSSNSSVDLFLSKLKTPIDILVNNAGINPIREILNLDDDSIENVLKVNLVSPIRLIRGILPLMVQNGGGKIVNISSVWSFVSKSGRTIYSASKGALNSVTRSIAVEVAPHNILVNAIAPGFVDTELTRKNNTEEDIKKIEGKIPLGRLAKAREIAELALFLSSDKNSYITGQTIIADGGYTCL